MRTTWEMQCKGLWGLSLGFPSAAYSLHFISWLAKCVAIHLEPTEVLWSTLLTSTPHNRQKKSFAAKIPVSSRRMLLEARLETSSMVFPHQWESIHPTEPTNCPLGQPEGPASHAVPKQAHKLAASFLCATPWLCEALRSLPTPHVSMGHAAVASVLLDMFALGTPSACKSPRYPCTHRYQ